MRRLFTFFALAIALAAPAALPAGGLPAAVSEALAQAGVAAENAGVFVQEVGTPVPAIEWQAEVPMNPASTMKLVTTLAALEVLGPAYTWKTEVYSSGTVRGGVLDGNLYLKGYGDPKLTLARFWLLLRELRQRGLRDIRGDLVLDRSYFQVDNGDPGAFDGEPYRPYNVGPDALLVNFNTVNLDFFPDPERQSVAILAEPLPGGVKIVNRLKLKDGPCGDWEVKQVAEIESDWKTARVVLAGSYPAECGEQKDGVAVLASPQYAYQVFRELWRELGGRLDGGLKEGPVPEGARLVAATDSPPLAEVIRDINKYSNNVMARQLFLTLGAYTFGPPATVASATRAVRAWLIAKHQDFPELVLENGSGLSRIERVSARHLGELLLSAYDSRYMPEFVASLPIAGIDGTMKRRLAGEDATGHAHLKTGYLEGVRALAGYVLNRSGKPVVVVCLVNDPNAGKAKAALDALVEWIYEHPAATETATR